MLWFLLTYLKLQVYKLTMRRWLVILKTSLNVYMFICVSTIWKITRHTIEIESRLQCIDINEDHCIAEMPGVP